MTPADDNFDRQFYNYVLDCVVPASAVQQPFVLTILGDADFEWWWNMVMRTSNLLKLLMNEQGTGRAFVGTSQGAAAGFNGLNIDLWAGTAQANAAFPLAVPFVMPATRAYQVLLTDLSAAPNTVQLVFSGFKLWPSLSAQPTASASSAGQ